MAEQRIPIVRFRDFILVSIQVELDDQVVMQLKEDITRTVETTRVRGLILDLTGIDYMDSYISRALRDISLICRLMGVSTVLCGMHPTIAMTLVEMGIELSNAPMALNLDAAMELFRGHGGDGVSDGDDWVIVEDEGHEDSWVLD